MIALPPTRLVAIVLVYLGFSLLSAPSRLLAEPLVLSSAAFAKAGLTLSPLRTSGSSRAPPHFAWSWGARLGLESGAWSFLAFAGGGGLFIDEGPPPLAMRGGLEVRLCMGDGKVRGSGSIGVSLVFFEERQGFRAWPAPLLALGALFDLTEWLRLETTIDGEGWIPLPPLEAPLFIFGLRNALEVLY
ncbi:MAG: hypothetical protein NZM37_12830 [Sandaracinaceae bacterium]|nr:hypothetical protein [Sandaracinaceae bacterium]